MYLLSESLPAPDYVVGKKVFQNTPRSDITPLDFSFPACTELSPSFANQSPKHTALCLSSSYCKNYGQLSHVEFPRRGAQEL